MSETVWHRCPICGCPFSDLLSTRELYDKQGAIVGVTTIYRCVMATCRSRHGIHEMIPEIAARQNHWRALPGA